MISLASFKGRPVVAAEILCNVEYLNYDRVLITSTTAQTVSIRHKNGVWVDYNTTPNVERVMQYSPVATTPGSILIKIPNREAITSFGVYFIYGDFINLSELTNLVRLFLSGTGGRVSWASPYLLALQSRLNTIVVADGWDVSSADANTFFTGFTKLKTIEFMYSYAVINRLHYTFLNNIVGLQSILFTQAWCPLMPDFTLCTSLLSLRFYDTAHVGGGGLNGNSVDYIPNTNTLKTLQFNNNNMTNANVNLFIDKIYAWANTNANNNVNLNIGGNNAAPSGTYDGTTDWSGGVPTSPKAKLWHLVNSRSWTITFTA